MNKVYLIGKIIEISDYKFYYNSKKYNSGIIIKIRTLEDDHKKTEDIELYAYNEVADEVYRRFNSGDIVCIEGRIEQNMRIEILRYEIYKEDK